MRTDLLPLCDKHHRTMEASIAPFNADYSIEYFRCTEKFCGRCFSERLGYVTPRREKPQSFHTTSQGAKSTAARCSYPALTANGMSSGMRAPRSNARKVSSKDINQRLRASDTLSDALRK